jgi:hypothetical protein
MFTKDKYCKIQERVDFVLRQSCIGWLPTNYHQNSGGMQKVLPAARAIVNNLNTYFVTT